MEIKEKFERAEFLAIASALTVHISQLESLARLDSRWSDELSVARDALEKVHKCLFT